MGRCGRTAYQIANQERALIDHARLLQTFLTLVQIDSPSGQETAIAAELRDRLRALDVDTHTDPVGNVVGRWEGNGPPLLLSAHMDTVAPGIGIHPVVEDGVVRSDGSTILGGDDKSGIAVILEALTALREQGRRPSVEIAFTVGEETGLLGAKALDPAWPRSREALVLDSGGPLHAIVYGAPASDKFDVTVHGQAAHAGSNPEDGINAILVAAQGIAHMPLGRIDEETTANIGLIQGGQAVNVVPDRVDMRGEARSHDVAKLDAQIAAMRRALEEAVEQHPGARLELDIRRSYEAYRLAESEPLIGRIARALDAMGEPAPEFRLSGGGSDANVYNARGITAVPISTGMQAVHTNQEWIAVSDMVRCAELVIRILAG
jgi:tripeptide aminopeptidase